MLLMKVIIISINRIIWIKKLVSRRLFTSNCELQKNMRDFKFDMLPELTTKLKNFTCLLNVKPHEARNNFWFLMDYPKMTLNFGRSWGEVLGSNFIQMKSGNHG